MLKRRAGASRRRSMPIYPDVMALIEKILSDNKKAMMSFERMDVPRVENITRQVPLGLVVVKLACRNIVNRNTASFCRPSRRTSFCPSRRILSAALSDPISPSRKTVSRSGGKMPISSSTAGHAAPSSCNRSASPCSPRAHTSRAWLPTALSHQ